MKEESAMFYLVETRFCAGLYLSKVAAGFVTKRGKAYIREFMEFEKAKQKLEEISKEADFPIPWKEFKFNHLYRIRDVRIYVVIYTSRRAGFVSVENVGDFIKKFEIDISISRTSRRLTYIQAVQLVWDLGAETGFDICGRKSPVCWKYYWRRKN